MIVAIRTLPYNSWKDPAERVMGTLNLGAQGVGLMRVETDIEGLVQGCSGLKEIQKAHNENPGMNVRSKVLASVQPCKELLKETFERLVYSGESLKVYPPTTEDQISALWQEMNEIDPTLNRTDTSRASVQDKAEFQAFFEKRCRARHYMFCVKKCEDISCKYYLQPTMATDIFKTLNHLSDPIPRGEWYTPFSENYGTETSERHRPSLTANPKKDKGMPFNPTKQTAMNVGRVLQCDECGKWRLMHSKCKVKVNNDALTNVLETIMYTCGTSLSNIEDEELLEGIYT